MTNDLSGLSGVFSEITKPVILGFPRALGMLILFPLLPTSLVPLILRNGIAVAILLPVYPLLRATLPDAPDLPVQWILYIGKEAAIGAAIGWGFAIIIWVMESVGGLLDIQTGTSSGATFDPLSQQPAAVFSQLLRNITVALFISVGGLLVLIRVFYESLQVWPVTSLLPLNSARIWEITRESSTQMLSTCLSIVLPFIVLLLIIELGLGLLNRTLPQLNVFSLSMPVKMIAAILIVSLVMGYLSDLIIQFLANVGVITRTVK